MTPSTIRAEMSGSRTPEEVDIGKQLLRDMVTRVFTVAELLMPRMMTDPLRPPEDTGRITKPSPVALQKTQNDQTNV